MENNREGIIAALKIIKGEEFDERHDLVYGGFLDSFELLALVEELERQFGIHVPLESISPENFDDIDLIDEVIRTALEKG